LIELISPLASDAFPGFSITKSAIAIATGEVPIAKSEIQAGRSAIVLIIETIIKNDDVPASPPNQQ